MLRWAARIVGTAVVTFVLAWALAECGPGSAAERAAGAAGTLPPTERMSERRTVIAEAARVHGLDGGAVSRIGRATARLATFDLGRSWRDRRPVGDVIGDGLGLTARIAIVAMVLALGGGAVAGAAAARTRGRIGGGVFGAMTAVAAAAPVVWLALMMVDAGGRGELAAAVALAIAPAAAVAVQVHAQLVAFLAGPIATAARARGCSEARVATHGLRAQLPALAPLITTVGAYALGASVVVERAFALPGLGRLTMDAAGRGDAPVLAGVAALAGAIVATLSVIAELVAKAADPRLRGEP